MQKRQAYLRKVKRIAKSRLVFVDESGFQLRMGRSHAWVKKGQEFIDHRPMNWGKNLTAVGAVRLQGWVQQSTMFAAMTKERFVAWFARRLLPKLKPRDVVVLDNLRAHHDSRLKALAKKAGISILYLPPYSPDFNPIEPGWAIQKKFVKRDAPRTPSALRRRVKQARYQVTSRQIRGWYRHAGYQFR